VQEKKITWERAQREEEIAQIISIGLQWVEEKELHLTMGEGDKGQRTQQMREREETNPFPSTMDSDDALSSSQRL